MATLRTNGSNGSVPKASALEAEVRELRERVASLEADAAEKAEVLRQTLSSWNLDMERLQKSQEREMDEVQRRTILQQHLERRDRALAEALARERALQAEVSRLEAQRLRAPILGPEVESAMPQVRDPSRAQDSPRSPFPPSSITETSELPSSSSLYVGCPRQARSMPPSRGRSGPAAHDSKCCSCGNSVTVVSTEDLQLSRGRTPSPGCLSARAILAAQPPVIAYSTLLPRSQYRTSSPRMSPNLSARTTPNGSSRMLISSSPSVNRHTSMMSNPASISVLSVAAGAPSSRGPSPEPVAAVALPLSVSASPPPVLASPPVSASPPASASASPISAKKLRQASPTKSSRERYLC